MEQNSEKQQIIDTVRKACDRLVLPWAKAGMELPGFSVVELARISKLSPQLVLEAVRSGEVVLNGRIPPQQAAVASIPNLSRFYQRTQAEIWAEGQRYQRRFQFQPNKTKGKPTSKRILARWSEEQTRRTKIKFVDPKIKFRIDSVMNMASRSGTSKPNILSRRSKL